MLIRLLKETFWRRRQRVAVAVLAVVIGSSLATALFAIYADIMDRMAQEMRAYGANILVKPKSDSLEISIGGATYNPAQEPSYLQEETLARLKTIFWRNNILGFAPSLTLAARFNEGKEPVAVTGAWFEKEVVVPKGSQIRSTFAQPTKSSADIIFRTGIRKTSPWWQVAEGKWAEDSAKDEALLGRALARRMGLGVGNSLDIEYRGGVRSLKVVGILSTGGPEEDQVVVPLSVAQDLAGAPGAVSRVLVSALTLPKEKLAADIRNKRPEDMTPKEYEKWYCSPIIDAITTQIQEVLPGSEARAIRQVSEAEGTFLVRIQWLMLLVAVLALASSALAVMTAMTASVVARRGEIGLAKALGAMDSQVATIFLAEAGAMGLVGGIAGYGLGTALSVFIGAQVFGSAIWPHPAVLAVSVLLGLVVALAGSAIPVRKAMQVEPVILLRQV